MRAAMHITSDQFRALVGAGIIGKVEYLDGRIVMEGIPMTLSAEQRAAAAAEGIELSPADGPGATAVEAALSHLDPTELRRRARISQPCPSPKSSAARIRSSRPRRRRKRLGALRWAANS